MSNNTIKWDDIKDQFFDDPAFKKEYDALESEYSLASYLIAIREATGLTQREFADKIGMKQSQIARIESGKQIPKLETLAKLALGAGYRIEVNFIPLDESVTEEIEPLAIAIPDDKINKGQSVQLSEVGLQIMTYLEEDEVFMKVRDRLNNKSLSEIAIELEQSLNLDKYSSTIHIFALLRQESLETVETNRSRTITYPDDDSVNEWYKQLGISRSGNNQIKFSCSAPEPSESNNDSVNEWYELAEAVVEKLIKVVQSLGKNYKIASENTKKVNISTSNSNNTLSNKMEFNQEEIDISDLPF